MKNKKLIEPDYSSPKKLEELVNKWRGVVGVDPIYIIRLKVGITEDRDLIDTPAWTLGLETTSKYPDVTICFNAILLQENKNDLREITSMIVHELIHIMMWDQLVTIDPSYIYEGLKARANEILTMKLTHAIMHAYYDKP